MTRAENILHSFVGKPRAADMRCPLFYSTALYLSLRVLGENMTDTPKSQKTKLTGLGRDQQ